MCDKEEEKEKWTTQARLLKNEMKDIDFEKFDLKKTGPVTSFHKLPQQIIYRKSLPQQYER